MRKGFSLLTAILFLVLIATISALSISLSTGSVKQTGDMKLKSQAELLLRSGTEYALLAISGAPNGCLKQVNIKYDTTFDINVTMMYIGKGLPANCFPLDNNISTPESNRTVIIDTVVTTNPNLTPNTIPEQIRLHRRTIQKP